LLAEPTSTPEAAQRAAFDLKLLWFAADTALQEALKRSVSHTLACAEGIRLSRALALVRAAPVEFEQSLLSFNPEDHRLTAVDPVRSDWLVRDRLGGVISAYLERVGPSAAALRLARRLLPGTKSGDLVRAMIRNDPEAVAKAYVSRAPSDAVVWTWFQRIDALVMDDTASEGAGEQLATLIVGSKGVAQERVNLLRALDEYLAAWTPRSRHPERVLRLIEIISEFHPPRGFARMIELFDDDPPARVRTAALQALSGYYRAPPYASDPAFNSYVEILKSHSRAPEYLYVVLPILVQLNEFDFARESRRLVEDTRVLESIVPTVLNSGRDDHAAKALTALYNACLRFDDDRALTNGQREERFIEVALARGWEVEDDVERDDVSLVLKRAHHPKYFELPIANDNRDQYSLIAIQRNSTAAAFAKSRGRIQTQIRKTVGAS
jgi:hypothetical protein